MQNSQVSKHADVCLALRRSMRGCVIKMHELRQLERWEDWILYTRYEPFTEFYEVRAWLPKRRPG